MTRNINPLGSSCFDDLHRQNQVYENNIYVKRVCCTFYEPPCVVYTQSHDTANRCACVLFFN